MIAPGVDLLEIWNVRGNQLRGDPGDDNNRSTGEIPGEIMLRYWEERGGGVDALKLRKRQRRENARLQLRKTSQNVN